MGFFRLKAGTHVQNDRTYKKGDVVETDIDLASLFPAQFDATGTAAPSAPVAPVADDGPVTAEPPKKAAQVAPSPPPVPPSTSDTDGTKADVRGRDVTKRFPLAVDEDFQIFYKKGKYRVYDIDAPAKALNPRGCTKVGVDKVIKRALEA